MYECFIFLHTCEWNIGYLKDINRLERQNTVLQWACLIIFRIKTNFLIWQIQVILFSIMKITDSIIFRFFNWNESHLSNQDASDPSPYHLFDTGRQVRKTCTWCFCCLRLCKWQASPESEVHPFYRCLYKFGKLVCYLANRENPSIIYYSQLFTI